MIRLRWIAFAALLACPASAAAQVLPLPSLPGGVPAPPQVGPVLRDLPLAADVRQTVRTLASERIARLRGVARRNPQAIELDRLGNPVRAGEVVVADPDDAMVDAAGRAGFRLIERETLEGLGIGFARFRAPRGLSIERALKRMRGLAGGREVSADPLHFGSGAAGSPAAPARARAPVPLAPGTRVGIVDGGVDARAVAQPLYQAGFAAGGVAPNGHATAVASLIVGGSGIRAAAPGAILFVADVYCHDPAGGSATAIARALAWMVRQQVPVVTVSLVGPANPLLARAVAAARARGTVVVAAVGNDGPAAPPAFPASYPGVIAVTGVDARNRALIEAGRADRLDYAAPGADMLAASVGGRAVAVRGTSFAAPFVAARMAAWYRAPDAGRIAAATAALDREAEDLGPRGPDRAFGRGLLCGSCRTAAK